MLLNKTVYIIGAGASQEAGLPTGDRLKETISGMLGIYFEKSERAHGDSVIYDALVLLAKKTDDPNKSIDLYVKAAQQISKALPLAISIDNYIDSHPGNDEIALCGKLAIVRSILEAEQKSCLFVDTLNRCPTLNLNSLDKTWYMPFFKLLTENCSYGDVLKEKFGSVVLIVFNYDRCIEHFMYYALQTYYNISGKETAELISCMNIYHPYGGVGSLPWFGGNNDPVAFGGTLSPKQLLQFAGKIKTFTEGTDPESSDISEIRNHINIAPKLVFLGFAFHKLNMELIASDLEGSHARIVKCYATTYRFSESDRKAISLQIHHLRNGTWEEIEMADEKCAAFFKTFSKSLAF